MNERNAFQEDPFEVRRMLPAEWVRREQILREARAARSAAMGELLVRAVAALWRGATVLAKGCREVLVWRDAPTPARPSHEPIQQNHR